MTSMVRNIEESLIERMRSLPPEKRKEVLDFAEFLAQQAANDQRPRRDIAEIIRSRPHGNRSKEDIDRQLAEERDWGDR